MEGSRPVARDGRTEGRLDVPLLALAVGLAAVLLLPPVLKPTIGVPGFTAQEFADLLTPVVAGVAFLWVFRRAGGSAGAAVPIAVALGGVWASAQGIHLAANAIRDAFPDQCASLAAFDATTPGTLAHFLDEDVGHWLWHLPWAGLLLLVFAGAARGGPLPGSGVLTTLAGTIHGAVWFFVTTEGGTWPFAVPFGAALVALGWWARSDGGPRGALARFLFASGTVSVLAFGAWVARFGYPPASLFEALVGKGC